MKVLLVNPPNPDPPPAYFGAPYGLSLLGAVLKARGHEVLGRDYDRAPGEAALREARSLARTSGAGLVGISCQSSNRVWAAQLSRELREDGVRVVVGGPFATSNPEAVLRRARPDWVAVGDGEETLPELVAALEAGADPAGVPGLVWARGGEAAGSPARAAYEDLDSLPNPDFELFDMGENLRRHRRPRAEALAGPVTGAGRRCLAMHSAIMLLSSRGCVYRCVYCPMSTTRGAPRRLSVERFVGQTASMARRYAWRDFVFGDNFFTQDRARVLDICAGLRREAPGLRWICMTRADAMDEALAAAMSAAGCIEVSYGVESGSPRVQKAIGKRLDLRRVPAAFEATRKAGMSSVLMLMVGNPGDDLESTRETAAFLRRVEPDRLLVHRTKVYPGTALHAAAEKAGLIPPGFYDGDQRDAPVCTLERPLAEIDEMKALLPSRTHYLEAGAPCGNGCCPPRRAGALERLGAALAASAQRAEKVVLGGGDALLLADLDAALDDAEALLLFDLSLYTTARPLLRDGFTARLRGRRALRRLIIPLFSCGAAGHDAFARVPGAYAQTVLALRRWATAGGEARLWLTPGADDLAGLAEWTRRAARDGAREFLFAWRRVPPGWGGRGVEDSPRLREFAVAAREAAAAAVECGATAAVSGLPPCLWGRGPAPRQEDEGLYDERVCAGAPASLRAERSARAAYAAVCGGCARRPLCDGLDADYLAARGEGEIHGL